MTYIPTIYDWPPVVAPISLAFRAGGASVQGGMTLGNVGVQSPEPGGRGVLTMDFVMFANAETNLAASWVLSRIMGGNIMRIRMFAPSVQLVPDSVFGINSGVGIKWSDGALWSDGTGWAADPSMDVTNGSAKGTTSFTVNSSGYNRPISPGHLVGFRSGAYDFTHVVMDTFYFNGVNRATLTVSPPLRRTVTTADRLELRPTMLVTCVNAEEVAANFKYGSNVALNAARFIEALV